MSVLVLKMRLAWVALGAFALASAQTQFLSQRRLSQSQVPTQTRPSDVDALDSFWQSVKGKGGGCAPGWGNRSLDPCVGEATDPHNAQGFGAWKGVACVPCPDEDYMCVAQIWLDGKCLRGTIPESFAGLTELWWLFLTNNNITGPLPRTNWATFPKLVSIDIAHNNINGDLPLDSMKSMPALRYIKAHHNMLDSVTYSGGGFESLQELKFIYNRNLTSRFPEHLATVPNLLQLEMHDTNISAGPVPTGPWPSLDFLLISGTGGLCGGALPRPCEDPEVFCDLSQALPSCDEDEVAAVAVEPASASRQGPTSTRPSDTAALNAFWQSVKGEHGGNAPGWGNLSMDVCVGDATDPHNAQGFGQWKGVACIPCPDEPQYYCVHEIFLDGKSLKGTIPESFRGLTELRYILLSNNEIKGPLPHTNWETFPKLVHLDISHNNITGSLPLTGLSKMPKLKYLSMHHNMLDEVCYHGGGFPELERLSIIYNRNMTGLFPRGLGELPALKRLEMHDTHLRGQVPTGPWTSLQLLLISGTGGLCGEVPSRCSEADVHCDLSAGVLPAC